MTDDGVLGILNEVSISLKYAHIERERRFLVRNSIPRSSQVRRLQIRDLYLIGTRLRLRSVKEQGLPTIFKLGQKIRIDKNLPSTNAHTTMYISAQEFDLLAQLPANELEKVRWIETIGEFTLGVDEFAGPLRGLILAEVDLGVTGTLPASFPISGMDEVTNDERFSGGRLAKTTVEELNGILNTF